MYSTQFQMESLLGFSAPLFVRSSLLLHMNPFGMTQTIDAPWTSMGQTNPFAGGFNNAPHRGLPWVFAIRAFDWSGVNGQ